MTRIEVCVDGLSPEVREALLETVWDELRISPGMVSADGNTELSVTQCGADPGDAPVVSIGGLPYHQVTPERLRVLLRRRGSR